MTPRHVEAGTLYAARAKMVRKASKLVPGNFPRWSWNEFPQIFARITNEVWNLRQIILIHGKNKTKKKKQQQPFIREKNSSADLTN